MPRQFKVKSVRGQFPARYTQHQLIRFLMIGLALLVVAYSLYFLLRFVNQDTPMFFKLLPLFIMFVGLDSTLRQTTSLNAVTFLPERMRFSFLLKKSIEIPYQSISRLELQRRITYYLNLTYTDNAGRTQLFKTPASFPHILEIIFNIADLAPQVEMNELLSRTVKLLRSQLESQNEQQI